MSLHDTYLNKVKPLLVKNNARILKNLIGITFSIILIVYFFLYKLNASNFVEFFQYHFLFYLSFYVTSFISVLFIHMVLNKEDNITKVYYLIAIIYYLSFPNPNISLFLYKIIKQEVLTNDYYTFLFGTLSWLSLAFLFYNIDKMSKLHNKLSTYLLISILLLLFLNLNLRVLQYLFY